MRKRALRIASGLGGVVAVLCLLPGRASAATPAEVEAILDNIWVFIAGCMVFFMQAGFAMLEAGLVRSKNVVNILAKNFGDALVGILAFFAIGYAFAYGGDGKWIGDSLFFLSGMDLSIPAGEALDAINAEEGVRLSGATDFWFQAMFAATAITIASGAMAERTKFVSYLVLSAVVTAFIYPVVVHWTWGGGFIAQWTIGDAVFSDFAGSGIVHMTGATIGLVGAIMLGPRIGKYGEDGKPRAIPGHSIPFAVLGVMILWLGWFGFNPGSELFANGNVMKVGVNTLLASVGGGFACAATIWAWKGKPDVAMIGNGILAGLVSITAGCGTLNPAMSIITGMIGGIIVVVAVIGIDRLKVDDPVGAIAVHGVVGFWGLLAIGLFARYDDAFLGRENAGLFYGGGFDQLILQALMGITIFAWVAVTTTIALFAIKKTIGLRVDKDVEIAGLDEHEHGLSGYARDVEFA